MRSLLLVLLFFVVFSQPAYSRIEISGGILYSSWPESEKSIPCAISINIGDERPKGPVQVVFLVDGSKYNQGRFLTATKEGIPDAIGLLERGDNVSIIEVSQRSSVILPAGPVSNSTDRNARTHMNKIQGRGDLDLMVGLDKVEEVFKRTKGRRDLRRYLFMIISGRTEESSRQALNDRITKLSMENDVVVSTFGCDQKYDEELLVAVSQNSGGKYYAIHDYDQFGGYVNKEMHRVKNSAVHIGSLKLDLPQGITIASVSGAKLVKDNIIELKDLQPKIDKVVFFNIIGRPASSKELKIEGTFYTLSKSFNKRKRLYIEIPINGKGSVDNFDRILPEKLIPFKILSQTAKRLDNVNKHSSMRHSAAVALKEDIRNYESNSRSVSNDKLKTAFDLLRELQRALDNSVIDNEKITKIMDHYLVHLTESY